MKSYDILLDYTKQTKIVDSCSYDILNGTSK